VAKGTARKVMLEERGVGNKGGFRFWDEEGEEG
jgi:hypothetical protein